MKYRHKLDGQATVVSTSNQGWPACTKQGSKQLLGFAAGATATCFVQLIPYVHQGPPWLLILLLAASAAVRWSTAGSLHALRAVEGAHQPQRRSPSRRAEAGRQAGALSMLLGPLYRVRWCWVCQERLHAVIQTRAFARDVQHGCGCALSDCVIPVEWTTSLAQTMHMDHVCWPTCCGNSQPWLSAAPAPQPATIVCSQ